MPTDNLAPFNNIKKNYYLGILFALILNVLRSTNLNPGTGRRCIRVGKNQHVVPANGRWGIRGEGNTRLTALYDRQAEAINAARQISRNQASELIIHGANGRIRERDSHGHDPFPPERLTTSGICSA